MTRINLREAFVKARTKKIIIVVLAIAIIASSAFIFLTPTIKLMKLAPPKPIVGIIELYGYILSPSERDYVIKMIDYALANDTIKAVVLKIDHYGGGADAIEEVYRDLLKLRDKKPVVTSIVGGALSGGYYMSIVCNYSYAVPSALVGNIGVIGTMPSKPVPYEEVIETGPYKRRGFSEKEFFFTVQSVLDSFIEAVKSQRKSKLRLNDTELSKAAIYLGKEAVKNGLVDEIGSYFDAIEKARKLAGLVEYEVVTINEIFKTSIEKPYSNFSKSKPPTIADLKRIHAPPAFFYVYIPPQTERSHEESEQQVKIIPSSTNPAKGLVLVDLSHDNKFRLDDLNILTAELASRGYAVGYIEDKEKLKEKLAEADAFIVITPGSMFSDDEVRIIENFTKTGRLLLIYEPALPYPMEAHAYFMNSLSSRFGIVFANGYLYNLRENYGNYRNIFITDFLRSKITEGLETLVLYTASHIYSVGNEVAFTSFDTFSSESDVPKRYSPIVFIPHKNVLAIGDSTFLREPFCYVKDNYLFLSKIADFLTRSL